MSSSQIRSDFQMCPSLSECRFSQGIQITSLLSPQKTKTKQQKSQSLGHKLFQEKRTFRIFSERKRRTHWVPKGADWCPAPSSQIPPLHPPTQPRPGPAPASVCSWSGEDCRGLKGRGAARRAGCGRRLQRAPFCAAPGPCWIGSVSVAVGVGGARRAQGLESSRSQERSQTERTSQLQAALWGPCVGQSCWGAAPLGLWAPARPPHSLLPIPSLLSH